MASSSIAVDQLRGTVARLKRIEEEIAKLNSDKRETYAQAKAAGFDTRALKKLILRQRKNDSQLEKEDETMELYERVLEDPLA